MELRTSFQVTNIYGKTSLIELYEGDVTKTPAGKTFDNLIISAFPNDYQAAPRSVIGSLKASLNINVQSLSTNKNFDHSSDLHCWTSQSIENVYRQITVFEPPIGAQTHENIKDVFQFLANCMWGKTTKTACTLLGSGSQGSRDVDTLESIIVNCVRCVYYGLPIEQFALVILKLSSSLRRKFDDVKREYENSRHPTPRPLPFQIILNGENNDKNYIDISLEDAETQGSIIDCSYSELQSNFGIFQYLKLSEEMVIFDRSNELWNSNTHVLCLLALIQQKSNGKKIRLVKGAASQQRFPTSLFKECYQQFDVVVKIGLDEAEPEEDAPIEERPNDIAQYVDMQLKYLKQGYKVDIVILYDVNHSDDFEKADCLSDALTENYPTLRVHKRDVRRDHGSGSYSNLDELKEMFTAIHRAPVVIALLSQTFLDNFINRLEFTLAQCCHASDRYPCTLISIALEDRLTVTENPGVKEVFTRDPIFKLINRRQDGDMFLSEQAIDFLSKRAFTRLDGNKFSAIFRPFRKNHVKPNIQDDNIARLDTNSNDNRNLKKVLILHDYQDEQLGRSLKNALELQIPNLRLRVDNVGIMLVHADSNEVREKLESLGVEDTVVYLLTRKFFDNALNVDAIYKLFLREDNGPSGSPFVRSILHERQFPIEVPMFIRRLPTYRWTIQRDAERRVARWILSDQTNSSAAVIMQPKTNFRRRENISCINDSVCDIWILDAEYPEDDDSDEEN